MNIKTLGTGCKNCVLLEKNVKRAMQHLKIEKDVQIVDDIEQILDYGVMMIPALVINEKVYSEGKALSVEEVKNIFLKVG